ncbi:nucleoside triphosphate pyrophosphohydrolase [Haemophilus influenzae]|uniref:Nucleoside triphosphate pyrophosphohydrolase n=1 Tax=Haemophilus influenzae TaxID=727 RepID=A0A2X1PL25_HAEIF|nr:nucleoside triphosphate pyrophosphohydrolase [Haemophilus influenzae]
MMYCKMLLEKIVRRHPHVFGDAKAADETEALSRLERNESQRKTR